MSQLIKQKFLEGIDSTKFKIAQNGAIVGYDSSGQLVEVLKVNSQNKAEVLGKVVANKEDLDVVISDLAAEVLARQAGDTSTLNSSKSYTDQKISDLVSSAPALLDTLNELAQALGSDPNFATTITNLIGQVQSALTQEIADRQAGDTALQNNINSLQTSLESDISQLESDLNAEISRATTAEQGLSQDISDLQSDLNAEVSRATAAEQGLAQDISDEETRAMAAELQLQNNIDAEQSARSAEDLTFLKLDGSRPMSGDMDMGSNSITNVADGVNPSDVATYGQLTSAINSESSARASAVTNLQNQIDNVLSNVDPAALDSLTEIVQAFQSADSNLNSAITNLSNGFSASLAQEILDRQAGDTALQNSLNQEISDRQAAVSAEASARQAAISAEESARIAGDSALQSNIDDVEGYAQDIRDDLDNLDGYAQDIRDDLDQEVLDRIAGDAALDARIDALEADKPDFHKMKVVIGSELGYIDLDHEAIQNSLMVSVGRLSVHKDEDYSVSVVGGKTRLTWMGDFQSGGVEGIETGMSIFVTYAY